MLHGLLGLGVAGGWVLACSTGGTGGDSGSAGVGGSAGGAGAGGAGAGGAGQAGVGGVSGSSGQSGAGGSAAGVGGSVQVDAGPDVVDEGCAGVEAQATRVPLSLYVALDRSSSIAGPKWDAALKGIDAFLKDPFSSGINVGLVTFPRQSPPEPPCSFNNYSEPQVPFGKLPQNTQPILDFLATVQPSGFGTPVYPALGGALNRGVFFKQNTPGENFAVLLITDGQPDAPPDSCGGVNALDNASIGMLAETALQKFGVRTFVIGLPGVSVSFAEGLAQKGGTQAILLQQSVELEKQFQKALSTVLGDGLGCEFPLPPDSSKYSTDQVNVRYTQGNGGGVIELQRSLGCKDGVGWDYDDPVKPTKVLLCGSTCSQVKLDGLARIDVVLGCPTQVIK